MAGGWYHVTNRGQHRALIFRDDRDREHFLELLEEMRRRHRVRVYAFVLMPNHYHVLLGTPDANASRAIQWLNVAYSVWFNRRHELSGHVFQGRFKAILVEHGAWGLELSMYMHLNPVAARQQERAAQRAGLTAPPSPEQVQRRLEELRGYKWSSYRAYAGYQKNPPWLDSQTLLERLGRTTAGRSENYRELVEDRVRQGVAESPWQQLKWGLVLGGERFASKVRGHLRVHGESQGQRDLRKQWSFDAIVQKVERIKGERWEQFRDRHGDWGRDVALWAGWRYAGLTLAELGVHVGGIHYTSVLQAIKRLATRSRSVRALRQTMDRLDRECNMSRRDPGCPG